VYFIGFLYFDNLLKFYANLWINYFYSFMLFIKSGFALVIFIMIFKLFIKSRCNNAKKEIFHDIQSPFSHTFVQFCHTLKLNFFHFSSGVLLPLCFWPKFLKKARETKTNFGGILQPSTRHPLFVHLWTAFPWLRHRIFTIVSA
jgi:hypothetical protein